MNQLNYWKVGFSHKNGVSQSVLNIPVQISFLPIRMKQLLFLLLLPALFFMSSCKKDDIAKRYAVQVTVNYPQGYAQTVAAGVLVKAVNTVTSVTDTVTSDAQGKVIFNLEAGIYNFSAVTSTSEFAFNGSIDNSAVYDTATLSLQLKATSIQGGLVFKEIYYSGSKTSGGVSYYADQFYEIYNNSDTVIYLDGLGIGNLTPTSSSSISVWVDASGNLLPRIPLQFYVWYIPGTGKEHPLQPRTSIIIAEDGINHQSDPLGNSLSPVNLGNANWESYCGDVNGGKDADAAGVPNLSLMFTTTSTATDWLTSVFGPAMVIFRLPSGTDPKTYASDAANLSTAPGSTSSTKYLMIPKEYILDAVEAIQPGKLNKRVPSDLDAGYVSCSSTYNSKSIRRKVKQIIDGKVIYKDTNNSTEDFLGEQTPTPGVNPTSVDN